MRNVTVAATQMACGSDSAQNIANAENSRIRCHGRDFYFGVLVCSQEIGEGLIRGEESNG